MNLKAERLLTAFADLPESAIVVEIGCVRVGHELPSEGYSTVYLAGAAKENGWELHSVDIDPASVANAKALTERLPVTVHQADGGKWLQGFKGPISGLYLDGAAEPGQALAQWKAARLADHHVVVIDDVQAIEEPFTDRLERGKGGLLLDALEATGYTVEIHETEPDYLMAVAVR